ARDDDARAALARARERGLNFIDTALVYGDGHSERLAGAFLREAGFRDALIATKGAPKSMQGAAQPGARLRDNFPAAWIRSCCERSLRNLGVERIDLLQLHVWAQAWTDQDDWYAALTKLREEGKLRLIGISINSHDPASAVQVVRAGRVDAVQGFYNVFDQAPEAAPLPACRPPGVGVLAGGPLRQGRCGGTPRRDTTLSRG